MRNNISTLKILLVDDEDDLLKTLKELLQTYSHKIITATNGFEAFEKVCNDSNIDLIISDYNMPHLTGSQLNQHLYQSGHEIPFILMTGQLGSIPKKEIDAMKAYAFLEKPCKLASLLRHIDDISKLKKSYFVEGQHDFKLDKLIR